MADMALGLKHSSWNQDRQTKQLEHFDPCTLAKPESSQTAGTGLRET